MACRKNFVDLTPDERDWLATALNALQANGVIDAMADDHDSYFHMGIHRGPAFLPWHRHFLLRLEAALQALDARVALPFWDWTRSDSRDLDAEPWKSFFGGRSNTGGRFDHWSYTRAATPSGSLPTLDAVIGELQATTYADFRAMEFGSHVPGHTWTGGTTGTMAGGRSPADPLFYLHHGNVDRLWAIWQRNHAGATQYTLDNCAGCDTIAETFVPLNDPMLGGATPASMLDHLALGYSYPRDDALETRVAEQGLPAVVSGDAPAIRLETPQIIFNDIPEGDTTKRAALFRVSGCEALTFHVTAGPTAPFSLFEPGPFSFPAGPMPTADLRIWVLFTGQTPGSVVAGTMTVVARDGFGTEVERWEDIPIFARSVARPRVAVAMVLDESGSMLYDAGYGRTRLEVLQLAATTFVDQLYDDNGLALVSFADAADLLRDLRVAGALGSGVRSDARGDIAAHGPADVYRHTSIGAGLQAASDMYAASPIRGDFDIRATLVFTDGFEDRAPLINDVRSLINERVYAVGVADAAHVNNDVLRGLADDSGGFMLVTGALAQDDEFLMEKFFIQVLAGVMNRHIVRDPDGWVLPGQVARVPFSLVSSDIAFDAVALSRAPQYLVLGLQTPDGTVVGPGDLPAGSLREGATSRVVRMTLPLVVGGAEHWEGEWELLLGLGWPAHETRIASFVGTAPLGQVGALPFHAMVHVRSNLGLRACTAQTGLGPGSTIHVRAALSEYGQPLETHPQVSAIMTRPDRTSATLWLAESGLGEFESSVVGTQSGAYRFLIRASGLSSRGQAFTREQLVSAVLGRAADGVRVPRPGDDRNPLCLLLKCLSHDEGVNERLAGHLEELGIDLDRLRRCLTEVCGDDRPVREVTVRR
jgi:hypothetical protein